MNITFDDLEEGLRVMVKHRRRKLSEEGIIEGAPDGTLKLRVNTLVTKHKMSFNVEKVIPLDENNFDYLAFDNKPMALKIKRREINAMRAKWEAAGVKTPDGEFASDTQSINRFNLLVSAKSWRTKDNKDVNLTAAKRKVISTAFEDHYAKAFNIATALKAELETIVDPENYDVEEAWTKKSTEP